MDPKQLTPAKTAAAIARVRAAEAELPAGERLFEDPFAHVFDETDADVQLVFDNVPFFREQVRLRTRYLDDCVREAIAAGVRRVVLLGAGFDMRAVRMPEIHAYGTKVVELDHGEQLEAKKKRLAEAGLEAPAAVRYAAADLMGDAAPLEQALRDAGLAGGEAVLWIAEGLLGYLSGEAVERLGRVTASLSGPGSLLVGNHFVGAFTLQTLAGLLGPAGWSVEAGPNFDELYRRHIGADVPPGSDLFGFMRASR